MNSNILIYLFSAFAIIYSLFYLIGKAMDEAKCYVCKYYGDKSYMVYSSNDKYRHYSCNHVSSKLTRVSHGSE